MDNQHTKISGYRDLTQEEIDLMNEAKQLEARCLAFLSNVETHLINKALSKQSEKERYRNARASRWIAMARTDLETGFMALVRAIAQPQPTEIKE
jgi:hypothetical protein